MFCLQMYRLGLIKVFTDADRNLIREERCKEAGQIYMPCSKTFPKLSLTFFNMTMLILIFCQNLVIILHVNFLPNTHFY